MAISTSLALTKMYTYNTATGVAPAISVGATTWGMARHLVSGILYVAATDGVYAVDLVAGTVTQAITCGMPGDLVAIALHGSTLYTSTVLSTDVFADPTGVIQLYNVTYFGDLFQDGAAQSTAADVGYPVNSVPFIGVYNFSFDLQGNMLISEYTRNYVWYVPAATGALCLVAGNGTAGSAGQVNGPRGVAFGLDNTVLIADSLNHRVVKVKLECLKCSA
jgi:hypothetical protein